MIIIENNRCGVVSMMRGFVMFAGLLFTVLADTVMAEQSRTFGNYTIHYSAFTTNILSPDIARIYNIKRSNNRALLNISVLSKGSGSTTRPVKARVEATATNLNSQLRQLEVREFVESGEPGAVYYLAETTVDNGETLIYNVNVTPEGKEDPYSFTFEQQFITE